MPSAALHLRGHFAQLGTSSPSLGNETGRLRVLKILFPWFRRVTWFVGEVRDGLGHRSVSGPRPPSAVWAHTRNVFRVVRRLGSGQASAQVLVRFLPQCVAHVHSRAAHWATAGACRSKGSENLQMQFCMAISVDYTVYNFQVRTLAAREHDTTCRELC